MAITYHVSKRGDNANPGTREEAFLTIQRAADLAKAGDTIIVHEGEYREWVDPKVGGLTKYDRITYQAAEGEKVVIKGSEVLTGWKHVEGNIYKTTVSNEMFGDYNPYQTYVVGDWMLDPWDYKVCTGDIYLNGKSLYQAKDMEELRNPKMRLVQEHGTWGDREEKLLDPEFSVYQWLCESDYYNTTIYINIQGADPNQEYMEFSVRPCCFYPKATHIDYITVRGFEVCHAATKWAPPTGSQPAAIGTHWSRGWIIEDNIVHDSKCCGISIGKEEDYTTDNFYTRFGRKPGFQYQLETAFKAVRAGWAKDTIGSHIIRRNKIYDCGQCGIVGNLGCIWSEIYENDISRISVKREFYGHEFGGIKLHAAIDVTIRNNYIHECSLGTWIDWQAQGLRISSNLYMDNNRDLMVEVTSGPHMIDNNILMDEFSLIISAQGGAYINNYIGGFIQHYDTRDRATPYHFPHSTEILGTTCIFKGDDRWHGNILVGGNGLNGIENSNYGLTIYDGAPTSLEEYIALCTGMGHDDNTQYDCHMQPVEISGNVYFKDAIPFEKETGSYVTRKSPAVKVRHLKSGLVFDIDMPEEAFAVESKLYGTANLGRARFPEALFEQPDGSELIVDKDFNGNQRSENPCVGPFENLKPGKNHIKLNIRML